MHRSGLIISRALNLHPASNPRSRRDGDIIFKSALSSGTPAKGGARWRRWYRLRVTAIQLHNGGVEHPMLSATQLCTRTFQNLEHGITCPLLRTNNHPHRTSGGNDDIIMIAAPAESLRRKELAREASHASHRVTHRAVRPGD